MSLIVNEIFHSIQGESSRSGMPCAFVRLTGCNLRCSYCDTLYAYEQGEEISIAQVVERVRSIGCELVEITGGEPLLQNDTGALAELLLRSGHTVLIETNGSIDIDRVSRECHRIVDVKCPSSGMAERNDLCNLQRLTKLDELKFVISTEEDYSFALDVLRSEPVILQTRCVVNFSPVFGKLPPAKLSEWILRDKSPVRLNLQLHKVIWHPDTRGV